jgi:hypothetical protein
MIYALVIRVLMLFSLVRGYQLTEETCYFDTKLEGGRKDGNRLSDTECQNT